MPSSVLLHLHGLCHPVLGAEQLGGVLDAIQSLSALTKPVLKIRDILVKDGQTLVEVKDELKTVVSLGQDCHPCFDLFNLLFQFPLGMYRVSYLGALMTGLT